ncbi:hypothetical protein L6164_033791 [Bauhinia variegata]|uniref:Uncharacterized protein n=1 Tax=Bauhinia variegata TaxID=167791 RepID=A0ACB9KT72_BAUVA|nr:hypothetical protein L6164_033791 [Bauhinia variegata]
MDEKDSTISASPGNTESGSPVSASVPEVMNMANVENSGGATVAAVAPATISTPASTGGGGSLDLFGKKKRGRPRKYDADGNLRSVYQSAPQASPGFSLSPGSPSEFSSKRGRGRPTGSGNWQLLASLGDLLANTAGGDFTPHVVTVHTGEDVAGKILQFAQKGPRGICILSANGAISNVTIRQPGSSGGLLTYEGRFEILSLSGSFTVVDNGGIKGRTGGLSVSLAGPDGRVIGGGVAGLLTAASPIQIVMGSFMPVGYKPPHKRKQQHREHAVVSPISSAPDTVTAAKPVSQANPAGEKCLTPTSQLPEQNQIVSDIFTSSEKLNLDATTNAAAHWNGTGELSDQRISPDINITLPGDENF